MNGPIVAVRLRRQFGRSPFIGRQPAKSASAMIGASPRGARDKARGYIAKEVISPLADQYSAGVWPAVRQG